MSGFPEIRRTLVDAGFRVFGESAIWSEWPVPFVVRFKTRDEDAQFSRVRFVERGIVVRVRSWDGPTPVRGATFSIDDGAHAGLYMIGDRPMLDAKGVWECAVDRTAQ